MLPEDIPHTLRNLIKLIGGDLVHLAVDKRAFLELPKRLQGVTTDVTGDMIEVLRVTVGSNEDIFAFTTANRAFQAVGKLQSMPPFDRSRYITVSVTPLHFLKKLFRETASTLTVDLGYPEEMVLHCEDYRNLQKLFLLARLARLEQLYVIQTANRAPISVEVEEGKMSVAFMREVDGLDSMASLREEFPAAKLTRIKPRVLSERVLTLWGLDGVIISPGSETQTTLTKSDLRTLVTIADAFNPNMFTLANLRRLVNRLLAPPTRDPRLHGLEQGEATENAREK